MLNDTQIKALQPKEQGGNYYLVNDKDGLYLKIYKSGIKSFIFNYKDPKTRQYRRVVLGKYPQMSLKQAREQTTKLRYNLFNNQSISEKISVIDTFFEVSEKYFTQKNEVTERTLKNSRARLKIYCKNILNYKIDTITKNDIMDIFEKLKLAKKAEVAKRLYSDMSNIFIYAVNRDLLEYSPMGSLIRKNLIYKAPVRHFATIIEKDKIQKLLGDILDTSADLSTKIATLMSLFTAQRSFNVRSAEWAELDLEKGIWQIPAEKMKMRRKHIVHLNAPCLEMLKFYKKLSSDSKLFVSIRSKSEMMSDNTIRSLFRRAGYSNDDFTPHGFRSMFSTICHEHRSEHGLSSDIIELCLSHIDKNAVRASYNFASNLDERKKLFEWWGGFLCGLEPRLSKFDFECV